ncbi:MAG TPA: YidB family protein [Blastocatellia bacterium]|nr:YidB family protein [Blastocatellia bacterium]
MAIFDSLVSEVSQKFGLGDQAGKLLAGLLSLITSSEGGGLSGFISKFTGAGLGNVVDSWISRGENTALTNDQLTSVLGQQTIHDLAENAGVSPTAATPAVAYMLPKVVDGLTPDGVVPISLPDTVKNYISGLGGMLGKGFDTVTGAAGGLARGAAGLADKGLGAAGDLASGATGAVGAGAAAVGAGLLGAAGAVGSGAKATAGAVGSGARAAADVASDTAKSGLSGLLRLLPLLLLALVAFLGYRFFSSANNLQTQQAAASTPTATVAAAATPIPTPTGPLNPEAAVKAAADAASGALATLKPGDAEALVKALNLQIINFASGSNAIPKENEDLLKKSAEAIKATPAGIKLEVGGHTDNKGAVAGNKALSQRRADAVKAFLVKQGVKADVLTAKGYGPDNPVASNDTDAGRFRNRRIEFGIVK